MSCKALWNLVRNLDMFNFSGTFGLITPAFYKNKISPT
jgi:hypothetical protein